MIQPLSPPAVVAVRLRVRGQVQGVGFRPFVYRLAQRWKLAGWVQNLGGEVDIHAQGEATHVAAFQSALIAEAPPLARPALHRVETVAVEPWTDFAIQASATDAVPDIHVPPDYSICADCLAELRDPHARRYRYPFINCTQCGPRYTIIRALPYDRPNTTLAGFPLCPDCAAEYGDPLDRRFHAQPLACPVCGPRLSFRRADEPERLGDDALAACLSALRAGAIIAVKGVGGYHLLCDAADETAVRRLRERKRRPRKPLAVMFPHVGTDGLDAVRAHIDLDEATATLLRDPMRPIVLARRRQPSTLAASLAPGLGEWGVFLPYSPLHYLLLDGFGRPLVATSGNLSGEPVITREELAAARLSGVVDAFLHHDRPIERPADDAVYRLIAGAPRPLRLGRGNAPRELTLAQPVREPLLAVGGHLKVTVALAWGRRCVISPHIGELDSPRSLDVFQQVSADLQRLYAVKAERLVCDAHPGYASTRWAERQGLPVTRVFHHHAHAGGLAGEHPAIEYWLMFTWDGVGYGADGTLWGGEALWGKPGAWRHVAGLRRFRLAGGERAGREPWRTAAALCWEAGLPWQPSTVADAPLVRQAWERAVNCPTSSAVGRLCDAAAALIMGIERTSFEGQGPMELEALASEADASEDAIDLPLTMDEAGVLRADWAPLLSMLTDTTLTPARRAALFHNSLAASLVRQTLQLRERHAFAAVGLTGGVFQNRLLSERTIGALKARGIPAYLPTWAPCNDGGLSFGQIVEAAAPNRSDPTRAAPDASTCPTRNAPVQ